METPDQKIEARELRQHVWRRVTELPDGIRDAILLYYYEGESTEQVAKVLETSITAVKKRLHKGREVLREKLWREMQDILRDMLPSTREWHRKGRALSIVLISCLPVPSQSAPASTPSGGSSIPEGLTLTSKMATMFTFGGFLIMKKAPYIGLAAAILLGSAFLFQLYNGDDPDTEVEKAIGEGPSVSIPTRVPDVVPKESEPVSLDTPESEDKQVSFSSIAGTVQDETANPLPSAEVFLIVCPEGVDYLEPLSEQSLDTQRAFVAVSEQSGRFEFSEIDVSGTAMLSAAKDGFTNSSQSITLNAGAVAKNITMTLSEGKCLRGTIATTNGEPVFDASVRAHYYWNAGSFLGTGDGFGFTDDEGAFSLGLTKAADACTLLVSSESLGQQFFFEVPISDEEVHLEFKEQASMWGRITWDDGSPAEGVFVVVSTEVPEPAVLAGRSGLRKHPQREVRVDANGDYEIRGLCPQFTYVPFVCEKWEDEDGSGSAVLSQVFEEQFELASGERKEWNCELYRPIVVTGRVITEQTSEPVPHADVRVCLGEELLLHSCRRADKNGFFRLDLKSGPGAYRIHSEPRFPGYWGKLIPLERLVERFKFEGGEELELDLKMPEPIVLPIRVLDAWGNPVEVVNVQLGYAIGGKSYGSGRKFYPDAQGHLSIPLYYPPASRIVLTVSEFDGSVSGSGSVSHEYAIDQNTHTVLPEETIVLRSD